MADPVVSYFESDDLTELNIANPEDFGDIIMGHASDPKVIHIWNNKGGSVDLTPMYNVRVKIVTANGLDAGDTLANGTELVTEKWVEGKSITNEDALYTLLGAGVEKTLANIRGDKLIAPEAPTGTPANVDGAVAEGTYYYVISALDETGETLQGIESAAVVVASPNNQVGLSWAAVPGATSYKIFRTTTSGTYGASSYIATVATNTYTDKSASPSTGTPLVTATVTYGHKHAIELLENVPSDATTVPPSGDIAFKLYVLYDLTAE